MTSDRSFTRLLTRRRLLEAAGVGALTSLSGCTDILGSGAQQTTTDSGPAGTATDRLSQSATVDESAIEDTLSSLSLEEKVGQMTILTPLGRQGALPADRASGVIEEWNVGGVLFGGANPPGDSAEAAAEYFNTIQRSAVDELGVPLLTGLDGVHGNATVRQAAVYPHQIGLAATWDTDMAYEAADRTARSMQAMGANWNYSPVADVAYDPRWGRYYECFSEDPHVTGAFVDAMVRGYERSVDGRKRVASSVKHFAGYSAPETGDDREPADMSLRTLEDTVFPPFADGIDAGAETVMANSGSLNGIPAHASEWLLQTVLRDRWGFDGLVTSDWGDIHRLIGMHGYASSIREATKLAVNAGVDMYMAPIVPAISDFQDALFKLVNDGDVSEDRIDDAVRRILRVKSRLGLFDDAVVPVENHTDTRTAADREFARRAAEKSLTLLDNDGTLPLGTDLSVLVTGPNADSARRQLGGWTMTHQGIEDPDNAPETVTIREGIESVSPDSVDVTFVETDPSELDNQGEVAGAAADADVAIAAIGEGAYAEGDGDINDLSLPQGQRDLVATLAESPATTVGVMIAGRPRGSPALFDDLDAALMAYYPGSEGGTAVARALFGEVTPAGRLPFTWPRSTGQIPDVLPQRTPAGTTEDSEFGPLFEFGTGRTYRTVFHTDVSLSSSSVDGYSSASDLSAEVSLENDGDVPTDESIILYAEYQHDADVSDSPAIPPTKQVVGFDRVRLEAGSSRTVSVPIDLGALAITGGGVDADGDRLVPAGEYSIGTSITSTTLTIESSETL